jgi:hypothetical protein
MEKTADARRGVSNGSRPQMPMHLSGLGNAVSAFYGSAYIMTLHETSRAPSVDTSGTTTDYSRPCNETTDPEQRPLLAH